MGGNSSLFLPLRRCGGNTWRLFVLSCACGVLLAMKTTHHLKSLINDLEVYERELKEKVQQKEEELKQLLQRIGPVTVIAGLPPSSFSGPWHLRITREADGKTDSEGVLSPSPCITEERRHLQYTVGGGDSVGKHRSEKSDAKQRKDTLLSIDIDAVSSISFASTSSAESVETLEMAQQLLTVCDRAKDGQARRVRFVSRSPQVLSNAVEALAAVAAVEGETGEKARGTPLPLSQASQALTGEGGDTDNKDLDALMLIRNITATSNMGLEATNHADLPSRVHEDNEEPCYIRGRRKQKEQQQQKEEVQLHPLHTVTSDASPTNAEDISAVVELPKVNSTPGSCVTRSLRRHRSESGQPQQLCSGPPAKRSQISVSPTVSAAWPYHVSDTQMEGRGAGIILACGPTLFFE
ncbi:hypothetical protein TcCL_ESM12083 [Trypanosoma cruzi]|uniref:Uncharacterized protein n=1 Tax=Trypanosoma cruzi (strain CL Brener) TaxID=353153 RepID=Q4CPL1_TRYCC|nr:hypothetical protein, conserved [Trypanosoma cruzi]EAN82213.1 hypothetical protein, conserved [Trypanosoma cruzi]RNC50858.1 hypothetical protein TcCL_ESM12083 [Trypanosoma cruzi]|eukprot:XP_804064.1 hypothetical protein [Trypanosoma cruzi strain CL Brener]